MSDTGPVNTRPDTSTVYYTDARGLRCGKEGAVSAEIVELAPDGRQATRIYGRVLPLRESPRPADSNG